MSEAAASWGIDVRYVDAWGHEHWVDEASRETIRRALERDPARACGPAPPVIVLRQGRLPPADSIEPLVPQGSPSFGWQLRAADGREIAKGHADREILLPSDLPTGIHRLVLDPAPPGTVGEATVIVAPERAYAPEALRAGRGVWLMAAQLYGVRSRRNWGHGDFSDLKALLHVAAEAGAAGVGLNPLHAIFVDRGEHASPYAPSSRLFLNWLYIDLDAVPEFPGRDAAGLSQRIAELNTCDLVDYAGVGAAKLSALRLAYASFRAHADPARRAAFAEFRRTRGEPLERYAAFEALRGRFGSPWWEWPEPWRCPDPAVLAELERSEGEEIAFHAFTQWLAEEQLAACCADARRLGLPIGLFLDLAIGVDAGGADGWSDQDALALSLSIGAPPDFHNPAGQKWGLAPFRPVALAASRFEPLGQMLDAVMRYAGAVRIDHVLGFNRMFLIPAHEAATRGTYVRYPLEAMLAVVALESAMRRCLVIGEDLGTVPEGLRETLGDWGLTSYRVLLFEREGNGAFRMPRSYPENALVTFSTHDLPTFAGWLSGHDLNVKRAIGVDPGESGEGRAHAREALAEALRRAGAWNGEGTPSFVDVARFLARTPSRLLVVSLEDILAVADQPNIPGTVSEHPNWRRRSPVMLEDLAGDGRLMRLVQVLREEGRAVRA
jgi:4-alpha-glucanotransferase